MSSIPKYQSIDEIAARLQLPRAVVARVAQFLIANGLCLDEGGKLKAGPRRTHLEAGSPFIKARQVSWRLKGFEYMDRAREDDLFYTAPLSVSSANLQKIRSELVNVIESVVKLVGEEPPEDAACLNIDWFTF